MWFYLFFLTPSLYVYHGRAVKGIVPYQTLTSTSQKVDAQVYIFFFGLRTEWKGLLKATNLSHSLYPKLNSSYLKADTSSFLANWHDMGKGLWLGFFVLKMQAIYSNSKCSNSTKWWGDICHVQRFTKEGDSTLSSPRTYWMLLDEIRYLSHLYDIGNNCHFLMFTLYLTPHALAM